MAKQKEENEQMLSDFKRFLIQVVKLGGTCFPTWLRNVNKASLALCLPMCDPFCLNSKHRRWNDVFIPGYSNQKKGKLNSALMFGHEKHVLTYSEIASTHLSC